MVKKWITYGFLVCFLIAFLAMVLLYLRQNSFSEKKTTTAVFLEQGATCLFRAESNLEFEVTFKEFSYPSTLEEDENMTAVIDVEVSLRKGTEIDLPVQCFYAIFGQNEGFSPSLVLLENEPLKEGDSCTISQGKRNLVLHYKVPKEIARLYFDSPQVFLYVTSDGSWNSDAPILTA